MRTALMLGLLAAQCSLVAACFTDREKHDALVGTWACKFGGDGSALSLSRDGKYAHVEEKDYPHVWTEWQGSWRVKEGNLELEGQEVFSAQSCAGGWERSSSLSPGRETFSGRIVKTGRDGLQLETSRSGMSCVFHREKGMPSRPEIAPPPAPPPPVPTVSARTDCKCAPDDLMCNMKCAAKR